MRVRFCQFLLALLLLVLWIPWALAAEKPAADKDKEWVDSFRMEELNVKLTEGLTLYYEGKYGRALPIFNEISKEVETMDLLWWIGTSAMNAGQYDLAVEKFKRMLAKDPSQHRVRLELALVYFRMGKYDDAQRELDAVRAANPPLEVRANIDRIASAIAEAKRKVMWNFRASLGFQWDDNVSVGPDDRVQNVGSGLMFIMEEDQARRRDTAVVTNVGGNVLYDIGGKSGFMWNTEANLYSVAYTNYGKYNYLMVDLNTGPWWAGQRDVVKIPFGYLGQYFGSDKLSYISYVEPSYEHYFNQYFSLRGLVRVSRETFSESYNNPLDNVTKRYEVTPNVYLFNRQHILSLSAGYEESDADHDDNWQYNMLAAKRQYSYEQKYTALSYFIHFPTNTELYLRYSWMERDYKASPIQWWYSDDRVDRRNTYTAIVSQGFLKHYFVSFAFNYIDNNSNAEMYSFRKTTYTLSVGATF